MVYGDFVTPVRTSAYVRRTKRSRITSHGGHYGETKVPAAKCCIRPDQAFQNDDIQKDLRRIVSSANSLE